MGKFGLSGFQYARVLTLGVFLLTLTACSQDDTAQGAPSQEAAPPVSVAQPLAKSIVEWDEYTARLQAVESVEVRARVSGYLESIQFKEGSVVQEGDQLFVIDPRPFKAELNRLEAQLKQAQAAEENARAQFLRAERLRVTESISEEEYQVRLASRRGAAADVQSARAGVEAAKLNLEFTQVRAPISGRISRPFVTEGNLVQGGVGEATELTTIVSLDPIHAYFETSERAYLKYVRLSRSGKRPSSREVRNPVYMRLADEEGFSRRGHMDFVDNLLDPNTGTMTGRAIFPNPDRLLVPGLFARVRVPGSGKHQALLIPDAAIGSDQTEQYVYVVDEDDAISYRKIKVGPLVHGLRVVREGLQPQERIVIVGLQRVRPGIKVTPESGKIEEAPEPLGPEDATPLGTALSHPAS
jgi:RND family efflux transporter MFP subunit